MSSLFVASFVVEVLTSQAFCSKAIRLVLLKTIESSQSFEETLSRNLTRLFFIASLWLHISTDK